MSGLVSRLSSAGFFFLVSGLWFLTWLLGFTNGNASSSAWMPSVAALFFILGLSQAAKENRRRES